MQSEETAAPTELPTESVKQAIAAERRMRRSAGINTAFQAIKAQHASNRSRMEVLADRMIGVASSTPFLVVHGLFSWRGFCGTFPHSRFPGFIRIPSAC